MKISFHWSGQLSRHFQALEHLTKDIAIYLYNKAFSELEK